MGQMLRVAILIDGGFFLKRYPHVYGKGHEPEKIAKTMFTMALKHVDQKSGEYLHRILFYDCQPFAKKAHNPISGKSVDFSKTEQAAFRFAFHEELKRLRKLALRLGHIQDGRGWMLRKSKTKELLSRKVKVDDLTEDDVYYDLRQKGVDIKIGIDIASLSLKRMVDRIVLISGDSDFVPAAKLARREGIDFVLDPMWNPIQPNLFEHIDGLKSTCPRPKSHDKKRISATKTKKQSPTLRKRP